MGFLNVQLPRTYEAYKEQALWCYKLWKDATKMGHAKVTCDMLAMMFYEWMKKAEKVRVSA